MTEKEKELTQVCNAVLMYLIGITDPNKDEEYLKKIIRVALRIDYPETGVLLWAFVDGEYLPGVSEGDGVRFYDGFFLPWGNIHEYKIAYVPGQEEE